MTKQEYLMQIDSVIENGKSNDICTPCVKQGTLFAIRTTEPVHRGDKLFLLEIIED